MRANGFMHVIGYATAVALAIGGTATALPGTNTVDSGDIINGQVKTKDLAGSAVKSGKVLNNSLKGLDIKDGSLTGTEITDNSLTGADVKESSLDLSTAGCQVGTILGAARIDGYNAPAMFGTGAWVTFPRNCSGGTIEVRRNGSAPTTCGSTASAPTTSRSPSSRATWRTRSSPPTRRSSPTRPPGASRSPRRRGPEDRSSRS